LRAAYHVEEHAHVSHTVRQVAESYGTVPPSEQCRSGVNVDEVDGAFPDAIVGEDLDYVIVRVGHGRRHLDDLLADVGTGVLGRGGAAVELDLVPVHEEERVDGERYTRRNGWMGRGTRRGRGGGETARCISL
jgi:hypothetical protein